MKEADAVKFRTEWKRLQEKRSHVDHEIAKHIHDLRATFAQTERGSSEAIDWIGENYGRSGVAARSLLLDGEAWGCVQSAEKWISIGGLRSARIVASLSGKQRTAVLSAACEMASKRGRPVSASLVREIAWRHGFIEKEQPKITEAKKAATLAAFVNRLYALGVKGLPPMPSDVRAIVTPMRTEHAEAA